MRIVTRPDFDGIVCAVLLRKATACTKKIHWVEPSEIQTGSAKIIKGDMIANLPFDPNCSLWFDHHVSNRPEKPFKGAFDIAPSAAGVVYKYYKKLGKLDNRYDELVLNTDMIDSADLTMDQVKFPENYPYVLLSMTIKNHEYEDRDYWDKLVDMLGEMPIADILEDTAVKEKCRGVVLENDRFSHFLKAHTKICGDLSVTDFRGLDPVPSGNRFLTYSLFPSTMASVKIRYKGPDKSKVLLSIGHSIFNPACRVNVGQLLSRFGGGGHAGAGGCTLDSSTAQDSIDRIIEILTANQKEAE